jgi:hypothetical protein
MYQADGLGVPTDFVNVWAAGRLVLDGHPALAYVVRPIRLPAGGGHLCLDARNRLAKRHE